MTVRGVLALLMLVLSGSAEAQSVARSAGPDAVAVTIYRSPDRDADEAIDRDWLGGYALISETRTVAIPAGRAVIRFEGVAAGMLAESAIVTGLPAGVTEKNLDADLLSPRSLYDRSLNRPVTIRRTLAGGRVETVAAVIRSAAAGAIVVQTAEGIESLQCSGLPEDIVYPEVPAGLSPKPTLSVETESAQAARATVTLSYLAWGFDWQANYVVDLDESGRARLFAWATLANGDVTGFAEARTVVIAGEVNREDRNRRGWDGGRDLIVRCVTEGSVPPPPPPPPAPPPMAAMAMDIVVTGARVARMAEQEELGDLKLYRIPFATTVAARSQKQVAMIDRAGVPVTLVHVGEVAGDSVVTRIELRTRNRRAEGLGLPLPGGPVAVFREATTGERLLAGEGSLDDRAVGEDVAIAVATPTQVTAQVVASGTAGRRMTVRNANPFPIVYEARLGDGDARRTRAASGRLLREDGGWLWRVAVPANGETRLEWRERAE